MMSAHNFFDIDGIKMHYIDQGSGDPILMLHGNPTWSYFYRALTKSLSKANRVVVPDHIGMGLSDKPQDVTYNLAFHIRNIEQLIKRLNLKDITLVVHDWGGAIGFGYAVNHIENVKRIVILNTSAFFDERIPKRIKMCRGALGRFLVQGLNLFAKAATLMTTEAKLPKEVRQAYLEPYDSYKNRIGIYSFIKDIPVEPQHETRQLLDSMESRLHEIKSDILILWGGKDFCFTEHFFNRWKGFFPAAKSRLFKNAGHYILEDAPDDVLWEIGEFIK